MVPVALLTNKRPVRLVEPGAAVVHGDGHHGIGTAIAAHLNAYHIVRHVDLTELDFRTVYSVTLLPDHSAIIILISFLGFPHPNSINGFQAWQLRQLISFLTIFRSLCANRLARKQSAEFPLRCQLQHKG